MNKKVSILIISVVLTIIVFAISTYMQKKLVNYIPTVRCMTVTRDVEAFENITEEDIEYVDMPIEIITKVKIAQNYSDIKDLYLKDKIYSGQIVLLKQFDTRENLMIYNAEIGKEKIAIKIKNSENGASFTIRENSLINVYATLRSEYINEVLAGKDTQNIGDESDGYCVVKLLEATKVLGAFDTNGEPVENNIEKNIDTILIAVTPEEAKTINLIRDIATFNVTELGNSKIGEEV